MLTLASRSLPTRYRRIEQTLDRLEARFVRAVRTLQQERLADLRPLVRATLEGGSLEPLGALDLGKGYEALLVRFLVETLGAGLGHGQSELDDIRARGRRVRALFRGEADGEPVVPDAAVDFVRRRRDLGRFFDADQVTTIRELLAAALQEGSSVATVMEALQAAMVGHFGAARAENIARTEATTAYNQGRLQAFLQAPDLVAALQFMAVLDARTTDICQHRDGLVFKLDDPLLRENTPPCHFQCRSLLSPVPEWELEEMGGSRLLARHRKKMATAPPNQQTSRGRFGSEPWPDAPGGAAPVPRTGPVGPQVGGDDGVRDSIRKGREPGPKRDAGGEEPTPQPPSDWIAEFHRQRTDYFGVPESERTPEMVARVGKPLREEIERRSQVELKPVRQALGDAESRAETAWREHEEQKERYKSSRSQEDHDAEEAVRSARGRADALDTELQGIEDAAASRKSPALLARRAKGEILTDSDLFVPEDMADIEEARRKCREALRNLAGLEERWIEVRRQNPEFRLLEERAKGLAQAKSALDDAARAYGEQRSRIVLSVVSRVRPFGGAQFDCDLKTPEAARLLPAMAEAARYYPDDWVTASNRRGRITLRLREESDEAGAYKDPAGVMTFDPGATIVAVHECGHASEHRVRGVQSMVVRFLEERIAGRRRRVTWRGEKEIVDYPGALWNDYASREYLASDGSRSATEVLSEGVEGVFFGYQIWEAQPGSADFILGAITTL